MAHLIFKKAEKTPWEIQTREIGRIFSQQLDNF